ncbi:MAG: thiamine phosphate synthase [Bdellovibrionales bacterium]|nr:thiamine phosphate synthase [Bdellovibrionales bacterium]
MNQAKPHLRPNNQNALYAIANIDDWLDPKVYVRKLVNAGVGLVQVRSKTWSDDALAAFCAEVLDEIHTTGSETVLLINDRLNVARSCKAHGVHLGQEDVSPICAREELGPSAVIGLSTHNVSQAAKAPVEVLDYIGFGPVFMSPTKQGHAPTTGTDQLRAAVRATSLPVVAIGGITLKNVTSVFEAGATFAAIISDLAQASSIENYAAEISSRRSLL